MATGFENMTSSYTQLLCPRVDPSDRNNIAVHSAAQNGHAAVAQLILADPRTALTADDCARVHSFAHPSVAPLLAADPRFSRPRHPSP